MNMKDIKTRAESIDVKIRDTALFAPKELSHVMKESVKAKALQERPKADESKATNSAVNEIESDIQGSTAYIAKRAYLGGKTLAQKRYENKILEINSNKAKQADYSAGNIQPVTSRAPQEYREEIDTKNRRKNRDIKKRSEQVSTQKEFLAPKNLKAKGKTLKSGIQETMSKTKEAHTQKARAYSTLKMQSKLAKNTSKRGASRIKQAVVRTARATIKALVGLLGGAGGLGALVLVIGGAAAVIATPFGIFWSGQDEGTMTMPMAVAQINAEYEAKLNSIESENPADSVVYHRIPEGGNYTCVSNWSDVIAVFACKTAGGNVDASDVVTIDEERLSLLTKVFWDMNVITYTIEESGNEGTEDGKGGTEQILNITIESKGHEEMMDVYHFSKSQKDALKEMIKPEYAQMLTELIGMPNGETALTTEQIAALMKNLPKDLPEDRKAVLASAYSIVGKVSYFWGGKSYAIGWDKRWGTPMKVTAPGSTTTGTTIPYGLDCSGFVDWAFYNGIGQALGTGGGTYDQYEQCRRIDFSEAIPGDIVFFSDLSHVGIYAGFDENGQPIAIQCGCSNGVSVTSLSIFSVIVRPGILE